MLFSEDITLAYEVIATYEKGGLEYTIKGSEMVFTEFINDIQDYHITRDVKELFTMEKKLISLMKNDSIYNLRIEIKLRENQKQLMFIRFFNDYDGVSRMEDKKEKYLTETHKKLDIKEGLKIMKKDFISIKTIIKDRVLEIKAQDVA